MKTIVLYACLADRDTTEGCGPMIPICYTETEAEAKRIVNTPEFYRQYGVQGCPPNDGGKYDVSKEELKVFDSCDEWLRHQVPSKIRKQEMAQLETLAKKYGKRIV
jgi:hypothetical protein